MMGPHEAKALRQLWVSVAANAVSDFLADLAKDPDSYHVRSHLGYFRGRGFREVCELAGHDASRICANMEERAKLARLGMKRAALTVGGGRRGAKLSSSAEE